MDQEKTGKFIAQCRKELGLTQAELAEKLGITDRAVSKWETGKCLPDASNMLELAGPAPGQPESPPRQDNLICNFFKPPQGGGQVVLTSYFLSLTPNSVATVC